MTYQLMSYQLFVKHERALTNAAERGEGDRRCGSAAAALPRKPMRACGVYED
jgi:hypothetical protein